VSPTPPSGYQAQGVNVSKSKYDMQDGKVDNNAIKWVCYGNDIFGFWLCMQRSKYVFVFLE
jgi:hypothetical protein